MIEHGCHIVQGQWLTQEASQSSTWQELRAVHKVLKSLTNKLQRHRVCWFTDNQTVVRILTTGSHKPALQQEALAIFRISILSCIRIECRLSPINYSYIRSYKSEFSCTETSKTSIKSNLGANKRFKHFQINLYTNECWKNTFFYTKQKYTNLIPRPRPLIRSISTC